MYKVMFFLKKPTAIDTAAFFKKMTSSISPFLADFDQVRLAIHDDDIAAAKPFAMVSSSHAKDAVLSVVNFAPVDINAVLEAIKPLVDEVQIYALKEYLPLSIDAPLNRLQGMSQIALLKKPKHLSQDEWLDIWLNTHTQVAIETQSTFSYRQNVVVKHIQSAGGVSYDAIVEEQFPSAAMTDRQVFFNSPNDEQQYRKNEKRMIDSVSRFVDFTQFECFPMSEYRLK